ncbi:hypothetical protein IB276_18110 [Ensifer sp. ENS04]|nr:hypothetical protein [Ensifer sp. ENS04]
MFDQNHAEDIRTNPSVIEAYLGRGVAARTQDTKIERGHGVCVANEDRVLGRSVSHGCLPRGRT